MFQELSLRTTVRTLEMKPSDQTANILATINSNEGLTEGFSASLTSESLDPQPPMRLTWLTYAQFQWIAEVGTPKDKRIV